MTTSVTDRFLKRKESLEKIFTEVNLVKVWREIVRDQVRGLDIKDLYDNYDINYNIESISKMVIAKILKGKYKPDVPLIYRVEKKYGVCRHLTLPSATDALVLQVIVEHIAPSLRKAQPSKNAYYSRDKHALKLPHEVKNLDSYPWFILWRKFQKEIFNFSKDRKYLVVTDVANYFDNIDMHELRNVISGRLNVEEAILDFLFNLIEDYMWNPDYLPRRKKGLPTINLEAIRLLGHVFLFEIDEVLINKSNNHFVRWMDDVNIGCDKKDDAILILSSLNDVLKSRGLALNLSKTSIYTSKEVKLHFLYDQNKYLDSIKVIKKGEKNYISTTKEVESSFKKHIVNKGAKNWDKVTKRYYTVAGKLKTTRLLKYSKHLFNENPGLRLNIIKYLSVLGFSEQTTRLVEAILSSFKIYDDVTLFKIVDLVISWNVPTNKKGKEFINSIRHILFRQVDSQFNLYCKYWFSAKYLKPNEILTLLEQSKDLWKNDPFRMRQACSLLPLVYTFKPLAVDSILDYVLSAGVKDASSVAANIKKLMKIDRLDKKLKYYLFPTKMSGTYPIQKYIILSNVLLSEPIRQDLAIQKSARTYVIDSWLKSKIDKMFK